MSASTQISAAPAEQAPLSDVMLAMDVVDTLRHNQNLVTRELGGESREQQLIQRLRDLYRQQGIEVSDDILKEGVAALNESRFTYTPPKPGLGVTLARLYVGRKKWLPATVALGLMAVIFFGGFYLVYKPYQAAQQQREATELSQTLPAEMDALYQTIFTETKVQQAANEADNIRSRGKTAASEGNREGALAAIADLTGIRDTLRLEYDLKIVNRPDVKTGFWTFPEVNTDATNYYVVVEALDKNGQALKLPIKNEETGKTEIVDMWGLRVPEQVYRSVEADKIDDGIVQKNIVGVKQFGFLDVDYVVPVLGGAVTQW